MNHHRIQLFQSLREFYKVIGLHPLQLSDGAYNSRNAIGFVFMTLSMVSSGEFFIYEAENIRDYYASFYTFITELIHVGCLPMFINNMMHMFVLMDEFEAFIEKNPNECSVYHELSEKIEKMFKFIHFASIKISAVAVTFPTIIISYANFYVIGLSGEESFVLPSPTMLPFDIKSPGGYFLAALIETISAFYTNMLLISIACPFIGSSWLIISFLKDITTDLTHLKVGKLSDHKNRRKLHRHFCRILQLHSDTKQFIAKLNIIYETVIAGFFLWSLSTMCVLLVYLQNQTTIWSLEALTALILLLWALALLFLVCDFGQKLINQFETFEAEMLKCKWYLFPLKLQQIFVFAMMNVQRLVAVQGFGNIRLTHEVSKKTFNAGFSYFMTLRKL